MTIPAFSLPALACLAVLATSAPGIAAPAAPQAVTAAAAASADIPALAGYDRFDVVAPHRAVLVPASIWYRASARTYAIPIGENPVFTGTPALVGAAAEAGKHPLILLSHGSGGNMDGLGWLSSALALRGAVVVAVNHPGTTSRDSSPRRTPRIDERAKDLSAALDTVLADPSFAPLIDTGRISALGFSLGGTTVLDLAGGRFERSRYRDYCRAFADEADCAFFRKGGVDLDRLPMEMEAEVRDPRIGSIVAVDPGMTDALSPESVASMTLPVLLISLGAPKPWRAADVSADGSNLAARLPQATHETIRPAVHFTFLGLCTPAAARLLEEEQDDPVCTDPAGSDRAAIHAKVIDAVADFVGLQPPKADLSHQ
jgi:predicted dienelactone hydrolase